MNGVQVVLRRRFGAQIQTSMDEQVLWFEWTQPRAIVPHEIFAAVKEGGMGLQALRLLGHFEFEGKQAWLAGGMTAKLVYEGPPRASGKWDLELAGFTKKDAPVEIINARPYEQPKVYQP